MRRDKSFRWACIAGALVAWSIYQFHLARRFPVIDDLLRKDGLVGWVARVVLWFTIWVLLALVVRWWRTRTERGLIAYALTTVNDPSRPLDVDSYFQRSLTGVWHEIYMNSQLRHRLVLWKDRLDDFNRSDRLSFLLVGQSSIDGAQMETAYGPLRAIVWALPGLGFMGTALEMSIAIRGMEGLGNANTDTLLESLMRGVIPALGGAFNITLFALGSSIICFLLLSLIHRQEEDVLHSADALSMALLSKISDERPCLLLNDDNSRYLATGLKDLRTVLQVLSWELEKFRAFLP
jgi:hypothetical protein